MRRIIANSLTKLSFIHFQVERTACFATRLAPSFAARSFAAALALVTTSVAVSGCALLAPLFPQQAPPSSPAISIGAQTVAAPAVLSADALAVLERARDAVARERSAQRLWTTAASALQDAERAAQQMDSMGTVNAAEKVIALCARSEEQAKSPPVRWDAR
jgi:hypothetical protein